MKLDGQVLPLRPSKDRVNMHDVLPQNIVDHNNATENNDARKTALVVKSRRCIVHIADSDASITETYNPRGRYETSEYDVAEYDTGCIASSLIEIGVQFDEEHKHCCGPKTNQAKKEKKKATTSDAKTYVTLPMTNGDRSDKSESKMREYPNHNTFEDALVTSSLPASIYEDITKILETMKISRIAYATKNGYLPLACAANSGARDARTEMQPKESVGRQRRKREMIKLPDSKRQQKKKNSGYSESDEESYPDLGNVSSHTKYSERMFACPLCYCYLEMRVQDDEQRRWNSQKLLVHISKEHQPVGVAEYRWELCKRQAKDKKTASYRKRCFALFEITDLSIIKHQDIDRLTKGQLNSVRTRLLLSPAFRYFWDKAEIAKTVPELVSAIKLVHWTITLWDEEVLLYIEKSEEYHKYDMEARLAFEIRKLDTLLLFYIDCTLEQWQQQPGRSLSNFKILEGFSTLPWRSHLENTSSSGSDGQNLPDIPMDMNGIPIEEETTNIVLVGRSPLPIDLLAHHDWYPPPENQQLSVNQILASQLGSDNFTAATTEHIGNMPNQSSQVQHLATPFTGTMRQFQPTDLTDASMQNSVAVPQSMQHQLSSRDSSWNYPDSLTNGPTLSFPDPGEYSPEIYNLQNMNHQSFNTGSRVAYQQYHAPEGAMEGAVTMPDLALPPLPDLWKTNDMNVADPSQYKEPHFWRPDEDFDGNNSMC